MTAVAAAAGHCRWLSLVLQLLLVQLGSAAGCYSWLAPVAAAAHPAVHCSMLSPAAADATACPPAAAVVDSCCWLDPTADAAVALAAAAAEAAAAGRSCWLIPAAVSAAVSAAAAAVAAAAPLHLFYSTFTCVDLDPQSS